MSSVQGYRVELDATDPVVAQRLRQHAGAARFVWNTLLRAVKANIGQRKAERSYGIGDTDLTPALGWSAIDLEKYWMSVRDKVAPWFIEDKIASRVAKETCRNLAQALKNWDTSRKGARKGKQVGFPRIKTVRSGRRFSFDEARSHPQDARTVWVPNVGAVRAREDMTWLVERLGAGAARITGATLRETAGRWWVSFRVRLDRSDINARRQAPADGPVVGVDLGLKTLAVIASSDGTVEEVGSLKPLVASTRKVRRLNKALARTQKDSKNRAKAVRRLGEAHLRVANRRSDYLHKVTTALARTKQSIVIEDLAVAGMSKNRKLSRAVHDAAFGEFRRQLEYKTEWYGSTLVIAERWYPSTKTCSGCGHVKDEMPLSVRTYSCESCGLVLDRDVNAARNLLALATSNAEPAAA